MCIISKVSLLVSIALVSFRKISAFTVKALLAKSQTGL